MAKDEVFIEARPGGKMAPLDSSDKGGRDRAKCGGVEETGEFSFGRRGADGIRSDGGWLGFAGRGNGS